MCVSYITLEERGHNNSSTAAPVYTRIQKCFNLEEILFRPPAPQEVVKMTTLIFMQFSPLTVHKVVKLIISDTVSGENLKMEPFPLQCLRYPTFVITGCLKSSHNTNQYLYNVNWSFREKFLNAIISFKDIYLRFQISAKNGVHFIRVSLCQWHTCQLNAPFLQGFQRGPNGSGEALTGELWGIHCEYFGEKWPCYNDTPPV